MKWPMDKIFVFKKSAAGKIFFGERLRRRHNLSKKMRRRQDFLDIILMGTLSS